MYKSNLLYIVFFLFLLIVVSGFTLLNQNRPASYSPHLPQDYETYESSWEIVDSLIKIGLPQSALEETKRIYEKAKSSANHPQLIKASLYTIRLKADFEEDFIKKIIRDLDDEITTADPPARQIFHSIIADIYWRYYQANRYIILDRTTLSGVEKDDIDTWDLQMLVSKVISHYNQSLQNPDLLKEFQLKEFNTILQVAEGSKEFRPTLFDFLAHRAVDFFMQEESGLTQPADRFEMDSEQYLSDIETFMELNIQSGDSMSFKLYALNVLQDLLMFHSADQDPEALVDVNLKRLEFVYQNSILPLKDSLYLTSLNKFEDKVAEHPSSANVAYKIALELFRQGQNYNPDVSEKYKWDIQKAHQKCIEVIGNFPESFGAKNCMGLKAQIEKKNISLTLNRENIPGKPILGLLEYKNLQKAWFRIIKTNYEVNQNSKGRNRSTVEQIRSYADMSFLKSWMMEIPGDGDFQPHSTEIMIPELSSGFYIILIGNSEKFDVDTDHISFVPLWVTNISFISQKNANSGYNFYVLDRENGHAMQEVQVNLYHRRYDYQNRSYEYIKGEEFISDERGFFSARTSKTQNGSNSFFLEFISEGDRLITQERFYHSGYNSGGERKQIKTFLFTDRSIYRPGQIVYFKGIALEKENDQWNIKKAHKTTVEIKDVNYQSIGSVDLKTNDFGSFSGSFVIPAGGLTGRMTIRNESGSHAINVEEYKRPTFEVNFVPIKGSYRLNSSVTVTAIANAFAGSSISGAQVKYRVVRETRFPWRYSYLFNFFPSQSMEIANGFTETDENGNFEISFTAIPDYAVPQKFKPTFGYTIYADVTDINNETRSAQTRVMVGYNALHVDVELPEIVNATEFSSLKIKTENLNGEHVPVTGKLSISSLKMTDRLIRERLWKDPDIHVITEENFIENFPFDPYKNETDMDQMPVDKEVFKSDFNSKTDSIIGFEEIKKWKPGKYVVTIDTEDEFGTIINYKKFITLFDPYSNKPPENIINWFHPIKKKCEPGEKASFVLGTADKDVEVIYEVVAKKNILHKETIMLSKQQKLFEVPVTEDMRGGFSINMVFIKHNRSYNNSFNISVPFSNKELDFEFETFRNKLTPGQKEEWKIRIKGHKGEKIASELLVSMYDASLDAFTPNKWFFQLYHQSFGSLDWNSDNAFNLSNAVFHAPRPTVNYFPSIREYDQLNWFGFNYYGYHFIRQRGKGGVYSDALKAMPGQSQTALEVTDEEEMEEKVQTAEDEIVAEEKTAEKPVQSIRRDFRETAFFYPDLQTNENGDVVISFNVPESLTRWNLMGLAHSRDLSYGQFVKEIVTQKELMVIPNPPRFFRQGDKMQFAAKISNLSDKPINGIAEIQFFHTSTSKDITSELLSEKAGMDFTVKSNNNTSVNWSINIPDKYDVISYRIFAHGGNFSDGEEKPIPVLTNRMLVTESLPLPVKGNETRTFTFDKLLSSGNMESLTNHKYTLEFSSNPAWYAVQALPFIMETEHESADHVFSRYYANTIASYLANSNPKIKQVFDTWQNYSPDALLSNLEKNQELKSLLLNETPWIRDAKNETDRKRRIAILFDINKMANERGNALRKLIQKQSPGGGWPWFKGMRDNRYVSQQIVKGFGQLGNLGMINPLEDDQTKSLIIKAIRFIDQEIRDDYYELKENKTANLDQKHLGNIQIQYLYVRSFFINDIEIAGSVEEAFNYYLNQAEQYWNQLGIYQKGMLALALNRYGIEDIPDRIMLSVKEHALYSDEMGMYWRKNKTGYFWYEAPVETQALLIEAFEEVLQDKESVYKMKIWLLKQKQTQDWETTRATADAVYALLLQGSDWLAQDELVTISVADNVIDPFELENTKVEAGTGYFKTSWPGESVSPAFGNIKVTNENSTIAWGAAYWQYFEDLDNITAAETPLKLEKKVFIEKNTAAGPVLEQVNENDVIKTGDKIIIRIEIRVDRDMEYVHMKDMRAAAFEPVNVISGFRFQGGLGYYESTRDASTNFYFDYVQKGTYVFEYPLIASQKGNFSNGITTIQCMYAPEFTSHSEGIRLNVE